MISILFNLLFFIIPFVFYTKTSELFEFNKIIILYIFTILIAATWVINCIRTKKVIFRHTVLDLPLLFFLLSQVISTLFSIDPITSIFGYYGRFNGGLLSTIAYCLLYWAYVSNILAKQTLNILKVILVSATVISIWAISEHFGRSPSCLIISGQFDTSCFIQDVRERVFATLGQPNWLAAWAITILPISWYKFVNYQSIFKSRKFLIYLISPLLIFLALIFTKSRSGLLGFATADFVFAIFLFFISRDKLKKFLILNSAFLILSLFFGTVWTPGLIKNNTSPVVDQVEGGTESGEIRAIVWKGAINVWRHYPIFGTGVETFGYSYLWYRPVKHNATSEWDFLYNKAHNEFLNYAATTGTVGLITYFLIIISFLIWIIKDLREKNHTSYIINLVSLAAGFTGLLVANFFGFSVVITSIMFFIIPAMSFSIENAEKSTKYKAHRLNTNQKLLSFLALCTMLYALSCVAKLWQADTLYTWAKLLNTNSEFKLAENKLDKAINIAPYFAIYYDELASAYTGEAVYLHKNKMDPTEAISNAQAQMQIEESLSPFNTNLAKSRVGNYIELSEIDPKYKTQSIQLLQKLISLAPTDPSSYYRLGLVYATIRNYNQAQVYLQKAVNLKPDYEKAQQALVVLQNYQSQKGQ